MTKPQADKWIRFLRSYGPITINENMYAENITKLSAAYGIPELRFQHPLQSEIFGSVDPANGSITNVVLTGTAEKAKPGSVTGCGRNLEGTYRNWTKDSLTGR